MSGQQLWLLLKGYIGKGGSPLCYLYAVPLELPKYDPVTGTSEFAVPALIPAVDIIVTSMYFALRRVSGGFEELARLDDRGLPAGVTAGSTLYVKDVSITMT